MVAGKDNPKLGGEVPLPFLGEGSGEGLFEPSAMVQPPPLAPPPKVGEGNLFILPCPTGITAQIMTIRVTHKPCNRYNTGMSEPLPPLQPIATDPKYGHYPWWPEEGDAWIHPDDIALARKLIPSQRIWRRDGHADGYSRISYGDRRLRVRYAMWVESRYEGFDVGDLVEILPHGLLNETHTGHIREVLWDEHEGGVRYQITTSEGTLLEHVYTAHDMKHVEPPHPNIESRIEPSGENEKPLEIEPLDE